MTSVLRFFFCLVILGAYAFPGFAGERHALLVGVQNYNASVSAFFPDLKGPENDLDLMEETLRETYDEDIVIAVLRGTRATRRAILDALDRLAQTAESGDEFILYFSGHGSQLPAPHEDIDEPDGLDEVFLPADTDIVEMSEGYGLQNHIRDTEIGLRVDQMQARGGFVWLIVDSCHSGTMLRGDDPQLTPRMAQLRDLQGSSIADLNPPLPSNQTGFSVLAGDPDGKTRKERFVGFYAAAPDSLAYEMPTGNKAETVHGIFTMSLSDALRTAPQRDFADLARETSARMWVRAGPRVQAMYGGALNRRIVAPFLGTTDFSEFAIHLDGQSLILEAGRLQGITAGTTVAIEMENGAARRHVLTARVTRSALDLAALEALPNTAETPNNLSDILDDEGLPGMHYADRWLADRAPVLRGRVLDVPSLANLKIAVTSKVAPPLTNSLAQTKAMTATGFGLVETDADVVLDITNDALILARNDFDAFARTRPLHLGHKDMSPDVLSAQIARIAKSHALVQLASTGVDQDMLKMRVFRSAPPRRTDAAPCTVSKTGHQVVIPPTALPVEEHAGALARLSHCDEVFVQIENTSDGSLDVSPFYVSADGSIFYLSGYPGGVRQGLKIAAGASKVVRFTESIAPAQAGYPATLLLLAVPSTSGPPKSFRYLATDAPVPKNTSGTRGGALSKVQADLRYTAIAWHFQSGEHDASEVVRE